MILALSFTLLACSTPSTADSPPASPATPAIPPIQAGAPLQVGQPAVSFTLPDTAGAPVSLADFSGKTVVLEWFNPDCPFVKYAYDEGILPGLHQQWAARDDVAWLAINSGAPGKQGHGADRNQQARAAWSMTVPVLLDESGAVGQRYGARTTPHMYVIDPSGTLVYAGGLDNAPLGRVEGDSRVDHVSAALGQVTTGQAVSSPTSKPYGCSVKYGS